MNEQIKLIEIENNALDIMIEKLLMESKNCNQCQIHKAKINGLTKALQDFTNSNHRLENILNNKKNFQNKEGVGFGWQKQKKSSKKYHVSKLEKYFG